MHFGVVLVLGLDDLATAIALRLFRSGFKIILCSSSALNYLHSARNFSGAIHCGNTIIDQIEAMSMAHAEQYYEGLSPKSVLSACQMILNDRKIPIVSIEEIAFVGSITEYIVQADDSIGLSDLSSEFSERPFIYFSVPADDNPLGYWIGRSDNFFGKVIYPFLKDQYPDEEASVKQESYYTVEAPLEGVFFAEKRVNDLVNEKNMIGKINNIPILSPVSGRITGISRSGIYLQRHGSFVEIDESGKADGRIIPQKCFALAGGVLEALLYDMQLRGVMNK